MRRKDWLVGAASASGLVAAQRADAAMIGARRALLSSNRLPTVVQVGTNLYSGVSAVNATLPNQPQAGNLLYIGCTCSSGQVQPSGWASLVNAAGGAVFIKISNGTEQLVNINTQAYSSGTTCMVEMAASSYAAGTAFINNSAVNSYSVMVNVTTPALVVSYGSESYRILSETPPQRMVVLQSAIISNLQAQLVSVSAFDASAVSQPWTNVYAPTPSGQMSYNTGIAVAFYK